MAKAKSSAKGMVIAAIVVIRRSPSVHVEHDGDQNHPHQHNVLHRLVSCG